MAVTGVNWGRHEMGKDGDDDVVEGPTVEAQHKSHQMAANSVNQARRYTRDHNNEINDVNSNDNRQEQEQEQEMTRRSLATGVRRRIFGDTVDDNTLKLRVGPSTKNKCHVGYKRSRNTLQAPSRNETTPLRCQNLCCRNMNRGVKVMTMGWEAVDKRQKGPKMAVTGVNWGRHEMGKDGDDDVT